MCHLKVIPIHFLEPEIGPTKKKNDKIVKLWLPTPKIPSITKGLLRDYSGSTRDQHGNRCAGRQARTDQTDHGVRRIRGAPVLTSD